MRIATVVGNRPQFVKAAAVSRLLRAEHDEVLIHTGQHYDDELSRIFFEELSVPEPERQLREGTGTNTEQTGRMLLALGRVFAEERPDAVLVYGDTNSTLAGAVAAAQARIPVAHIEAGMRSFDRSMPEEFNRVLTDHASDLLLCSTPVAVENLGRESVAGRIDLVGDVMADVALTFLPIAERRSTILEDLGLDDRGFILVTAHRAGNVDPPERLEQLVGILESLPAPGVFPVHPRTRKRLDESGLAARLERADGLRLLPPIGYLDLLRLAGHARAVLTDSGGLQKEAYVLGTPCVTARPSTEWVETVQTGWNVLVDLDRDRALEALVREVPAERPDLYGNGTAGARIVASIGDWRGRG